MRFINQVRGAFSAATKGFRSRNGSEQELDLSTDPTFAAGLETWGAESTWPEIKMLLQNRTGKVLDLACGTGRAWDEIKDFPDLDYYGCDISPLLIEMAAKRCIPKGRLATLDAANLSYASREFDFLFSIGSLEHFTVEGLRSTIKECKRVCKGTQFHMVPVSLSGFNEGWISPLQGYWCNNEAWWKALFAAEFGKNVWTMGSSWRDGRSRGIWIICGAST